MKKTAGNQNDDHGQAILEFALAMPFLLAWVFFIVDCGFFAFSYVSLTNAVREGARCAAVGGTEAAVSARVTTTYGGTGAPTATTVTWDPAPASIGGSVHRDDESHLRVDHAHRPGPGHRLEHGLYQVRDHADGDQHRGEGDMLAKLHRHLGRVHREESQSIVTVALMSLFILAILAVVVESSAVYIQRRNLQNAADAAALAGAQELNGLAAGEAPAIAQAEAYAGDNVSDLLGVTLS